MKLFTKQSLDELQEKTDPVKCYQFVCKTNRMRNGECPFCEKLDVFRLDSSNGEFYCEECSFKGDSLLLFMMIYRLNFVDAIEKLSAIFKVDLDTIESKKKGNYMDYSLYPTYEEREQRKKTYYKSKAAEDSLEKQAHLALNCLIWAHYWRAREHLEEAKNYKRKLRMLRGKKYHKDYQLDIDHYTNHWLGANGERILGLDMLKYIEQEYGYKPEKTEYLPDGHSSYYFGGN